MKDEVKKDAETRGQRRGKGEKRAAKEDGKKQNTEIDRSAVAKIVFEDSQRGAAELKWLEQLTHPRIRARLEAQLADLRARTVRWPS